LQNFFVGGLPTVLLNSGDCSYGEYFSSHSSYKFGVDFSDYFESLLSIITLLNGIGLSISSSISMIGDGRRWRIAGESLEFEITFG